VTFSISAISISHLPNELDNRPDGNYFGQSRYRTPMSRKKPTVPTTNPKFTITAYTITWRSADPLYDHTLRLVPTVTLFGPNQDPRNPMNVLICFYPDGHVVGATQHATHNNTFYLELPITHAANLIHLLETHPTLTFEYKHQATRTWAEIYTPKLTPGQ
jgi:hypothetical protein